MDPAEKLTKAEAILLKVRQLRVNQKLFFSGKKWALQKCKDLEKDIDKDIADYWAHQPKLF